MSSSQPITVLPHCFPLWRLALFCSLRSFLASLRLFILCSVLRESQVVGFSGSHGPKYTTVSHMANRMALYVTASSSWSASGWFGSLLMIMIGSLVVFIMGGTRYSREEIDGPWRSGTRDGTLTSSLDLKWLKKYGGTKSGIPAYRSESTDLAWLRARMTADHKLLMWIMRCTSLLPSLRSLVWTLSSRRRNAALFHQAQEYKCSKRRNEYKPIPTQSIAVIGSTCIMMIHVIVPVTEHIISRNAGLLQSLCQLTRCIRPLTHCTP